MTASKMTALQAVTQAVLEEISNHGTLGWPLDGELALASHRVVMKRFVFLVICIAVGASLSGCASSREAFFNDMWNGSGESGGGGGAPLDRGGTSGGATGDYEGP